MSKEITTIINAQITAIYKEEEIGKIDESKINDDFRDLLVQTIKRELRVDDVTAEIKFFLRD